ncbi:MAG: universal stress protein [Nitrososphaeraceae archaeon]
MASPQKDEKSISTNSTIDSKSEVFSEIPQFHKILVPYDGTKMSDKALSYAIYLSKISVSDIFILNIVEKYSDLKDVLPTTIRAEFGHDTDWDKISNKDLQVRIGGALRELIEDKVRLCKDAGVVKNISYEIRTGNAADEIIKVANQSKFDVIVMASHRLTSTIRGIGSTTRRVIDTIKKPVLVIYD